METMTFEEFSLLKKLEYLLRTNDTMTLSEGIRATVEEAGWKVWGNAIVSPNGKRFRLRMVNETLHFKETGS